MDNRRIETALEPKVLSKIKESDESIDEARLIQKPSGEYLMKIDESSPSRHKNEEQVEEYKEAATSRINVPPKLKRMNSHEDFFEEFETASLSQPSNPNNKPKQTKNPSPQEPDLLEEFEAVRPKQPRVPPSKFKAAHSLNLQEIVFEE